MKNNIYSLKLAGSQTQTGPFSIYQGKNGAIYFGMGESKTLLNWPQLDDLKISLYELENFDHDEFLSFYKNQSPEKAIRSHLKAVSKRKEVISWIHH